MDEIKEIKTIKKRKSKVKEIKKGYFIKIRPSIVAMAKKFVSEDEDTKSFNSFLEDATVAYIKQRKRVPRDHDKQAKMNYED